MLSAATVPRLRLATPLLYSPYAAGGGRRTVSSFTAVALHPRCRGVARPAARHTPHRVASSSPSPPPPSAPSKAPTSASPPPPPATATGGSAGRGPLSWASLVLLVLTGGGLVAYFNAEKERRRTESMATVTSAGKAMLGGPWRLVDSDGNLASSEDFKGGYTLLYFGFTYCPDICPNELVKMGKVIDLLDKQTDLPQVTPVFISLDPNRDTVTQMRTYKQDFHPKLVALTGTPGQIADVAKAFRVYFTDVDRDNEDDDDYVVDHSIVMYFMDPDGEFLEFFTQLRTPEDTADTIAAILRARALAK